MNNKHLRKIIFSYLELSFLSELKNKTKLIYVQTEVIIFYEKYAEMRDKKKINHKYGIKYLINRDNWSIFIK